MTKREMWTKQRVIDEITRLRRLATSRGLTREEGRQLARLENIRDEQMQPKDC